MSALLFYTLFYLLMAVSIVYPPKEFASFGLTIKDVLASWLGNEREFFIQYHIRRSTVTLLVHSFLPSGYILGLIIFDHVDAAKLFLRIENSWWVLFALCSLVGPSWCLIQIFKWSRNNWAFHPIAQCLEVYCEHNTVWSLLASDINTECRRVDKIIINTNGVTRVIVTDNWIIKIMPYRLFIARQNDTALVVNKIDTHPMSLTTRGEMQYINVQVKPARIGVESFDVRLNTLDFKDLQNKISQPIVILQNITFHKTLLERFIDTFKEQVSKNPLYRTAEELEQCFGCMQSPSNVKLNKLCDSANERVGSKECGTCYCRRPMWCIECMATWFASRQDENTPGTWLSSKCICPVCRARFCLLDVCLVSKEI